MPQISIINIKDIIEAKRFDAEYFKPEYLEIERKIKSNNFDLVKYIFEPIKNGVDYRNFVEKGNRKYIRTADIKDYGYTETAIDILLDKIPEKVRLKKEDILFTRKGNYGKNCIVDSEVLENALISSEIMLLRKKDDSKYNVYYLSIFLRNKFGQKQIERNIHGVSNFSITQEALENIKIPLLPQSFQLQIEKIVKEAYQKQSLSKQLYKEAEQILLEELDLVNFKPQHKLTFTTTKKEITQAKRFDAEYFQPKYKEIIEKIKNYKGGCEKIGEVVNWKKGIEVGSHAYTEEGKDFVRVSDFSKFGIENVSRKIDEKLFEKIKNDFQPKKGEILFTKDGTIGISYVLKEDLDGVLSGAFLRLFLKEKYQNFEKEVLALVFNSIITKLQVEKLSGGALISHLKPSDFEKFLIPLIPISTQQKISQKIQESFKLRKEAKELLEQAKRKVEEEIEKAN